MSDLAFLKALHYTHCGMCCSYWINSPSRAKGCIFEPITAWEHLIKHRKGLNEKIQHCLHFSHFPSLSALMDLYGGWAWTQSHLESVKSCCRAMSLCNSTSNIAVPQISMIFCRSILPHHKVHCQGRASEATPDALWGGGYRVYRCSRC